MNYHVVSCGTGSGQPITDCLLKIVPSFVCFEGANIAHPGRCFDQHLSSSTDGSLGTPPDISSFQADSYMGKSQKHANGQYNGPHELSHQSTDKEIFFGDCDDLIVPDERFLGIVASRVS